MATREDETTIRAYENGPYVVRGRVRMLDADGNEYDTDGKTSVALCRCGRSENKPFCDGTHSEIGFRAAERAAEGGEAE